MWEINRGGHFPDLKLAFIDRNGSPSRAMRSSQFFFTSWSKILGFPRPEKLHSV
jgi:hypothetical protein